MWESCVLLCRCPLYGLKGRHFRLNLEKLLFCLFFALHYFALKKRKTDRTGRRSIELLMLPAIELFYRGKNPIIRTIISVLFGSPMSSK